MTSPARTGRWEALPASGRIVVHVYKKGLLSAFAHDHHFEATAWRATGEISGGDPATASVELVVDADSLRDRQPSLSRKDLREVEDRAAGPDVLDARRHPRVEFRSQGIDLEPGGDRERVRGKLHGTVTLRGRSVPTEVALDAARNGDEWRVRGSARLKQTAFGIEPFSGFGGTIAVKDAMEVEFEIVLHLARAGETAG